MKIANMTPLEAAGSILAWGLIALLALIVIIVLVLVARAGYQSIKDFGSTKNGRK